jgi:hypothetical protein
LNIPGLATQTGAQKNVSAAAVNDVVGWLLLALVTTLTVSGFVAGRFALRIGMVAAFGVISAARRTQASRIGIEQTARGSRYSRGCLEDCRRIADRWACFISMRRRRPLLKGAL